MALVFRELGLISELRGPQSILGIGNFLFMLFVDFGLLLGLFRALFGKLGVALRRLF